MDPKIAAGIYIYIYIYIRIKEDASILCNSVGKGTNAAKNSGYFPACSAVMMLKIEARSVCTRMKGCSLATARNKSRKNHFYARTRTEFCCEC